MANVDPPNFALRSTPSGAALLVEVVGEVDMITAPALSQAIELTPDGTTSVVIDLSEVTFLDSSGLNALVQARRVLSDLGVGLQVVVPPEGTVRPLFEITHLTEPLDVIDSRPPQLS